MVDSHGNPASPSIWPARHPSASSTHGGCDTPCPSRPACCPASKPTMMAMTVQARPWDRFTSLDAHDKGTNFEGKTGPRGDI
eukprot:6146811-Amphidinium_carterae.1